MIYLSKGLVCKGSTEELLKIVYRGREFQLTKMLAVLWLNGRYGFAETKTPQEESALLHLLRMGLAESELENQPVSRYRIFSRCILCPAKKTGMQINGRMEKDAMIWIRKAGLRLSTAELVWLFEHDVKPQEQLLYAENRQALVEKIYTADTIADNVLETQMEYAAKRDVVIDTLLRLLRKKKIVIM